MVSSVGVCLQYPLHKYWCEHDISDSVCWLYSHFLILTPDSVEGIEFGHLLKLAFRTWQTKDTKLLKYTHPSASYSMSDRCKMYPLALVLLHIGLTYIWHHQQNSDIILKCWACKKSSKGGWSEGGENFGPQNTKLSEIYGSLETVAHLFLHIFSFSANSAHWATSSREIIESRGMSLRQMTNMESFCNSLLPLCWLFWWRCLRKRRFISPRLC